MTGDAQPAPTRRDVTIAAVLGMAAIAAGATGTAEAEEIPTDAALKALDPWIDAIMTNDPAVVEKVLAPEYQTVRSDGSGHDKESYLKALPKQRVRPTFSHIVARGTGDLMVLRYRIETDQTIQGKEVKGVSPRLSVFRLEAGRWLISAHANFAALR